MKRFFIASMLALALTVGSVDIWAARGHDHIEAVAQGVSVEVTHSGIDLSNNGPDAIQVTVFTITGARVKTFCLAAGERISLDVPAGYYIVKTPQRSARVLVK